MVGRQKRRIRIPWYRKILYSILLTIAFFGLVEAFCYIAGIQGHAFFEDPYVGFSSQSPLFELERDSNGIDVFRTAQNKIRWFNDQSFPKQKAPGSYRIFCMGGSTTYGHPFKDDTSFAGWLRAFLPVIDSSKKWEIVNAGGISYASYRVAKLMEELAQYQPDIFIVYSVHNEFLERRTYPEMFQQSQWFLESNALLRRTHTWSLVSSAIKSIQEKMRFHKNTPGSDRFELKAEVDEMLNHTIGPVDYHRDADWHRKVISHYEVNLHRMISIARKCGAKIVFATPTVNEKNCSPFKSQYRDDLSKEELQQISGLLEQMRNDPKASQPEIALNYWQKVIQIDSRVADYHYRLGQSLYALGKTQEAFQAFRRAIREDVCPLRAIDEITEVVERVTDQEKVPLVNFEKRLRRRSKAEFGHEIFGEEYFLDHVHPTIEINRQLALWIIEVLQDQHLIKGKSTLSKTILDQLDRETEKVMAGIDPTQHAISQRNLAKVFHWAGKYEEAIPHSRDALKQLEDDQESRFVLADSLSNLDRLEESAKEYERLFSTGKDYFRAYEPFGFVLSQLGEFEAAKAYFMLALLHNDKSIPAYIGLGKVHLELQEWPFAEECFLKAQDLDPKFLESTYWLARAKAASNKHDEAIGLFKKVIEGKVRAADVHFYYASSLEAVGDLDESRKQLRLALEIRPNWNAAEEALEELQAKP